MIVMKIRQQSLITFSLIVIFLLAFVPLELDSNDNYSIYVNPFSHNSLSPDELSVGYNVGIIEPTLNRSGIELNFASGKLLNNGIFIFNYNYYYAFSNSIPPENVYKTSSKTLNQFVDIPPPYTST
jgi:hypothetical protein